VSIACRAIARTDHARPRRLLMTKGWIAVATGFGLLLAVAPWERAAANVTQDDFSLNTTHNLVDLCSVATSDPMHDQAKELCLGYIAGAAHLHRVLADNKRLVGGPMACPTPGVSREGFAQQFITYANAHTQYMNDLPAKTMALAAAEYYPCPKSGSSTGNKGK